MESGSIVLTPMPQADGQRKNRPALVLCATRPFGDLLICGISTQLRLEVAGFDEIIAPGDEDFRNSGLAAEVPHSHRLSFHPACDRNQRAHRQGWALAVGPSALPFGGLFGGQGARSGDAMTFPPASMRVGSRFQIGALKMAGAARSRQATQGA